WKSASTTCPASAARPICKAWKLRRPRPRASSRSPAAPNSPRTISEDPHARELETVSRASGLRARERQTAGRREKRHCIWDHAEAGNHDGGHGGLGGARADGELFGRQLAEAALGQRNPKPAFIVESRTTEYGRTVEREARVGYDRVRPFAVEVRLADLEQGVASNVRRPQVSCDVEGEEVRRQRAGRGVIGRHVQRQVGRAGIIASQARAVEAQHLPTRGDPQVPGAVEGKVLRLLTEARQRDVGRKGDRLFIGTRRTLRVIEAQHLLVAG